MFTGQFPATCPMCDGEIERGTVSVHGTVGGFLLVGMSYQHCFFKGDESEERVVLGSRYRKSAFRCKGCGFVGMFGEESVI
jgi:hypothetical protein